MFAFGSSSVVFGAPSVICTTGPGLTEDETSALRRYAVRIRHEAAQVLRTFVLELRNRAALALAVLTGWAEVPATELASRETPPPSSRGPPGCRSAVTLPTEADLPAWQASENLLTEGSHRMSTQKRKSAHKGRPSENLMAFHADHILHHRCLAHGRCRDWRLYCDRSQ
jgi:hypothetical protein